MELIDREKLPESYLNWLDSGKAGQVKYQGSLWQLKQADALLEELRIDGKRLAFHKALSIVAQSLVNVPPIQVEGGSTFERSRLAEGFAIAEDNFDFLFIDGDGSVWSFWHSALSVSRVGSSFSEVLETVEIEESCQQELESILGRWAPVSSSTDDMASVLDLWPIYSFETGSLCVMEYDDNEIDEGIWNTADNDLDERLCIRIGRLTLYLEFLEKDTLSVTNAVKDLQITYKRS